MIEKLKKIFWKPEGLEDLKTPQNVSVDFLLLYENKVVGYLSLNKGIWTFKYSEEFKYQNEILPLVDFPDKTKVYASEQLSPFFASRIPGLNQPSVQKALAEHHVSKDDEVGLLKLFGKRTISNPFLLEAQPEY